MSDSIYLLYEFKDLPSRAILPIVTALYGAFFQVCFSNAHRGSENHDLAELPLKHLLHIGNFAYSP